VVGRANASIGGPDPFSVTCIHDKRLADNVLGRYAEVLRSAGFEVMSDPDDGQVMH
jgi:hypothetical protein